MKSEKPADDVQPLSAADVQGALRVLRTIQQMADIGQKPEQPDCSPERLLRLAKCIRTVRKDRAALFSSEIFGEPSWEILLLLYIAAKEQQKIMISAVCRESGVPESTALRWLERLITGGLVRRVKAPLDARVFYVELTPECLVRMDEMMLRAAREFHLV